MSLNRAHIRRLEKLEQEAASAAAQGAEPTVTISIPDNGRDEPRPAPYRSGDALLVIGDPTSLLS